MHGKSSQLEITRKWKAKAIVDNPCKEPMEEDPKEEALIDKYSPPHRDADAVREEEDFL